MADDRHGERDLPNATPVYGGAMPAMVVPVLGATSHWKEVEAQITANGCLLISFQLCLLGGILVVLLAGLIY